MIGVFSWLFAGDGCCGGGAGGSLLGPSTPLGISAVSPGRTGLVVGRAAGLAAGGATGEGEGGMPTLGLVVVMLQKVRKSAFGQGIRK